MDESIAEKPWKTLEAKYLIRKRQIGRRRENNDG